jgi:transposase-like protein
MRNLLEHRAKTSTTVATAIRRQAFVQPHRAAAGELWRQAADQLRPRSPRLAVRMDHAEHDARADLHVPEPPRTKLLSTNLFERLAEGIRRCPVHKSGPAGRGQAVRIPPNESKIIPARRHASATEPRGLEHRYALL